MYSRSVWNGRTTQTVRIQQKENTTQIGTLQSTTETQTNNGSSPKYIETQPELDKEAVEEFLHTKTMLQIHVDKAV